MTNMTRTLSAALFALLSSTQAVALGLNDLDHIHGLAHEPGSSQNLLLATHAGIFRALPDGKVERISSTQDDFMALASSPSEPGVLYASGHPVGGGNLGLLKSTDGGRNWVRWSDGYNGPVDFHHLAVSPSAPSTLYGVHNGLQVSRDGGRNWQASGTVPPGLLTLAVSSIDPQTLFAATERGLLLSRDGGGAWRPALLLQSPATVVHVGADGTAHAFVVGSGLMRTVEPSLGWQTLFNAFGGQVPLALAVSPVDPSRLAVLTQNDKILVSEDGSKTWRRFGVVERLPNDLELAGKALYTDYCQACHGVDGVGENFALPQAGQQQFIAPALDDTAHAWHHTDDDLKKTIREGSPRTEKMPAWKALLSDHDLDALIAYMKSLWTPRELACQGPKHMNCPKDAGT